MRYIEQWLVGFWVYLGSISPQYFNYAILVGRFSSGKVVLVSAFFWVVFLAAYVDGDCRHRRPICWWCMRGFLFPPCRPELYISGSEVMI